ncbi:MAG: hypothetical protein AB8H80_01500, partial [Planctomycetota bacterium]
LGTNHTALTAGEVRGPEPLLWIETEPFRLGCSLPAMKAKVREPWGKEWRKRLDSELAVMRKRFPSLKKGIKTVDPWLRAHLYAYRLEQLYVEVLEVLQKPADWFPQVGEKHSANNVKGFPGLGPHMGMSEKFVVLLLQKASSHARYTGAFHGHEVEEPQRYHDVAFCSMYWGASQESANSLYKIDYALHTNLVFNVAHNLYSCFRSYGHDLPPWLVTGLAHSHARRISPRFPTYDRKTDDEVNDRSGFWDWDKLVKGLVKNKAFEPLEDLVSRDNAGAFGIEQHMQSWAVAEFLRETRPKQLATFLHDLKGPFYGRLRIPSQEDLGRRQSESFPKAFGCSYQELDAEWRKYALKRKRRRKR